MNVKDYGNWIDSQLLSNISLLACTSSNSEDIHVRAIIPRTGYINGHYHCCTSIFEEDFLFHQTDGEAHWRKETEENIESTYSIEPRSDSEEEIGKENAECSQGRIRAGDT
ncbi:hypothetical protein M422DRAFT_50192 [Sphaerobolus stellatus SS14]|uniref:Uncharacterized protein n=1 Tax=Sphaerobolus stellatus (strain SS14) TaxID=990650 RepID=A0A0C9VKL9_SPHS4|nr:hypothetical protein M422DRAFT_50192 [Sphaerobolus stellatus SS14]